MRGKHSPAGPGFQSLAQLFQEGTGSTAADSISHGPHGEAQRIYPPTTTEPPKMGYDSKSCYACFSMSKKFYEFSKNKDIV